MSKLFKFMAKAGLASALAVGLLFVIVAVTFANGGGNQGTCPHTNGWTKINSGDLSSYPVLGATAYCFKAGPFITNAIPSGGFGQEGACEAEHIERCGLSHWSYFMGDVPEYKYWAEADCYVYTFYLQKGNNLPIVQLHGSWAKGQAEICLDDMCVSYPLNCDKPCVEESVFYWSDGFCMMRQRGGPIGGQQRPFMPMQDMYCGCGYAHEEGWEGFYAESDCKGAGEEYTYWNELPLFCGAQSCE